ncbi:MAG: NUDIX hydrolase [Flavobacteriales bacterium]|nr:NUDIX hydrolase [Flavobacteriales bacterium]
MPLHVDSDEEVFHGKYIRVVKRHFRDMNSQPGVWETVYRKTHGPIVAVVAVTPQHEVILNRIWRVPLGRYTIEFPAGLMDKAGEAPEVCAARELLEETGYATDGLTRIMAGVFNAGLTPDELWVYLGLNAQRVAAPQQESTEDIEVLRIPIKDLMAFLAAPGDNVAVDLKLYGIIPFLQLHVPQAYGRG